MDVEPMGTDFVVAMCHDIEDPTFDATAIATNPRAQVRPIHRPPRVPADRSPACHWTVSIANTHPELPVPAEATAMAVTRAATFELSAIDTSDSGRHDYSGPLVADLQFSEWSQSALRRIIDEVCLQGHLLVLSFLAATARRAGGPGTTAEFGRRQFTGVAGVAAARLRDALDLPPTPSGAARLLALHPALQPYDYVHCQVDLDDDHLVLTLDRQSAAMADGAWPSLLDAEHLEPLDAMVWEIDPHLHFTTVSDGGALVVELVRDAAPAPLSDDVLLTRFSTGTTHTFVSRGTPVAIRPSNSGG
jgi:hypothetical protein